MQTERAPLLTRANVTNKLRQIRAEVSALRDLRDAKKGWDARLAIRLQKLEALLKKLQREHTFLIVDNT